MKKYIILFYCFFFGFATQIFAQTYLSKIRQASQWKQIVNIDTSVNNLLESKIIFPKQKVPDYIYQPSFLNLISSGYKNLTNINIAFPKSLAIKKKDKINSYFRQLKNGNFLSIQQNLEKIASSSSVKNQLVALWLAQIYYQKNNLAKTQIFLDFAYLSENHEIALQAEYLQALIYLKTKEYQKIKLQIKNWNLSYRQIPIPQQFYFLELLVTAKEGKYQEALQKINKFKNTQSIDIFLVRSLLYYKLHQYQNSYKNLQKIKLSNYKKQEQQEIYYLQLWVLLFIKDKKKYQKIKKVITANTNNQIKQELEYLFLIEKILNNKPVYKKLNNLTSPLLQSAGLLLLEEKNLLTKPQRDNFFKNDIALQNSQVLFYYNIKKAAYLREKKLYFQALNHLFTAQYQTELHLVNFKKEELTKLSIAIGVAYLQQNNTEKAAEIFTNWSASDKYFSLVNYYLAGIYYRQINPQRISQLKWNKSIKKDFATEFLFFQAWSNYRLGNAKTAIQMLQNNNKNLTKSLLYGIYFQRQNFQEIIKTHNTKAKNTYHSDKFYILSLLAEQKPLVALEYLEKNNKQTNPLYYQLYLEALLANKLYQKSVEFILENIKEHQESAIFTAYLAKIFFLLAEHKKSIQYLENTILLTKKSQNISYNIFLNNALSKTNLLKEAKNLQKNNNNPRIFFQKNLLLTSQLEARLQWKAALGIYQEYLKQNSDKKITIHLLIQRNFYLQSYFDLCLEYGKNSFQEESEKEKQDRQITNIYCSYNTKKLYDTELAYSQRKDKKYREHSWRLINILEGRIDKNIAIEQLNLLEQQYYFIYLAKTALLKENPDLVLLKLKNINNTVFFSENKKQIYLLKASAYLMQNKNKQAINHLIKLLYSPLNQETQIILIFKILPLLLEEKWHQEAKQILAQINKEQLSLDMQSQYLQILKDISLLEAADPQ